MEYITPLNCPFLSVIQIQNLQANNITTFIDLVHAPKEVVCTTLEIPESVIFSSKIFGVSAEYRTILTPALTYVQPQPVSLRQIVVEKRIKPTFTGIEGLDKLLGGGLFPGDIIELYGKTGSGKTLLSLYLTSRVCHFSNDSPCVLYFDMKNDFNALRLHRFCNKSDESLTRVRVFKVANHESLLSQLEDIRNCYSGGINRAYCRSKLLVVDSVPMAIYPAVEQELYSWRFHQEKLVEKLRWIANHLNLTVVLINHAVNIRPVISGSSVSSTPTQPTVKAAMGKYWLHKINIRINLTKNGNDFNAILEKSSRTSEGQKFKFSIAEEKLVQI